MTPEDNQTVYEEILSLQPEDELHRAVQSQALIPPRKVHSSLVEGRMFHVSG